VKNRKVSIATVSQAYLQLEAQGYLEARPQSGYYVCHRPPVFGLAPMPLLRPMPPAQVGKNAFISQILDESRRPGILPLGSTILDASFLPVKTPQSPDCQASKRTRKTTPMHRLPVLKGCGVKSLAAHWIPLVRLAFRRWSFTSGCMEALNLALRTLAPAR
jgi:DNA-binding transcriptional MocR family regulator